MSASLKVIGPKDGWHTNDGSKSMHFFVGDKSACGIDKTKDFVQDNNPELYCKKCVANRNAFLRGESV